MKTRADSVRALKEKNTRLQQTLFSIQQELALLSDAKPLSQNICPQLEIKQENDYFILSEMIEKNPELKTMHAGIKQLAEDIPALESNLQETDSVLKKLESEVKQPAEVWLLDAITTGLNKLVTPKNREPVKSTLDQLLRDASNQLDIDAFKKNLDYFLDTPIGEKRDRTIKNFIEVKKVAAEHKKDQSHRVVLTSEGRRLVLDVERKKRTQDEIKQLQQDMVTREEKVQQLKQAMEEKEKPFLEKIFKEAKEAKDIAKVLSREWGEASKALGQFPVSKLKEKAEFFSMQYLGMESKNRDGDFLGKMEEVVFQIEREMKSDKTEEASTAIFRLAGLKSECEQHQERFGSARVWLKLSGKIQKEIDDANTIRQQLSGALETLRGQASALAAFREENPDQPEMKKDESEPAAPVAPVSVPAPPAKKNKVNPIYKTETQAYLGRLSESLTEHLETYQKVASLHYAHLVRYLRSHHFLTEKEESDVKNVRQALEKAYQHDVDQTLQKEIDTILVLERTPESKPETAEEKKAKQKSLKYTLHKYRLMTELLPAANESSETFLSILRKTESQTVLAKRRDTSFILWARGCGYEVARMLGVAINWAYSCVFFSQGEKFSKQFKHEPVENKPDHAASHRVGG
ncbi:MAG TPA: hypothetical protein VLJ15_00195 [Gammaproteobacteria bacterium]|nr:hypothetical protein [Gammaproteobacteria bacterium]